MLKLSNFQCWPELGGWANQDDLLVNDVLMWLALERRMAWEAERGIDDSAEEMSPDVLQLRLDQL